MQAEAGTQNTLQPERANEMSKTLNLAWVPTFVGMTECDGASVLPTVILGLVPRIHRAATMKRGRGGCAVPNANAAFPC